MQGTEQTRAIARVADKRYERAMASGSCETEAANLAVRYLDGVAQRDAVHICPNPYVQHWCRVLKEAYAA